jgi:hypothetical protein
MTDGNSKTGFQYDSCGEYRDLLSSDGIESTKRFQQMQRVKLVAESLLPNQFR